MSDEDRVTRMGENTKGKLRGFISRIENIEAEQAELAADKREVYAEAKTFGFDTKIIRKAIAKRKQDPDEAAEQEALLEMYLDAVGLD